MADVKYAIFVIFQCQLHNYILIQIFVNLILNLNTIPMFPCSMNADVTPDRHKEIE